MRLTIAKKIMLPFIFLIFLMVVIGTVALIGLNTANNSLKQLVEETVKQHIAYHLQSNASDLLMAVNDYIITGKEKYLDDYENINASIEQRIVELKKNLSAPEEQQRLHDINNYIDSIHIVAHKIFELKNVKINPKAAALMEEMDYRYGEQLYKDVAVIIDSVKGKVNSAHITVKEKRDEALSMILTGSLLAIIIAIAVVILTIQKFSKPILELVKIAQRIAGRDFSVELQPKTKDEIGILVIAFNTMVTEIRKRYEELENFSYIVAHDLKSPLNGIIGSAEALITEYENKIEDEGKQFLQNIIASGKRMSLLISDLLEFATSGQVEFSKEPISMNNMLNDIQTEFAYTLKKRNVKLVVQPDLPSCICDPVRFPQVWRNLISNAIKYNNNPAPCIEIGLKENHEQQTEHCFFIKDNGIGIEASYLDKIFMPFQRAVHGQEYEGTGIGLAIVKRIIEFHNGRIWVESKKDEGTIFYFIIPKSVPLN